MLTLSDLKNVAALLQRAQYQGIEEAQVGTLLYQKVVNLINKPEEYPDGGDTQAAD